MEIRGDGYEVDRFAIPPDGDEPAQVMYMVVVMDVQGVQTAAECPAPPCADAGRGAADQ